MTRFTRSHWISTSVFATSLGLGAALLFVDGCGIKTGCVNCHIGGVLANPSEPNPSPDATLELQLEDGGMTVTSVEVTISADDGSSETHKYEGSEVSGINANSPTTISDNELYDVNGQIPTSATATIEFDNGRSLETSLGIERENTGSGGRTGEAGRKPYEGEARPVERP